MHLILLAVATILLGNAFWAKDTEEIIWSQLSAGFLHERFVEPATTIIIRDSNPAWQKLWIPDGTVDELRFFIDCPLGKVDPPHFSYYLSRKNDTPATVVTGHTYPFRDICVVSYRQPTGVYYPEGWVWLRFTSEAGKTPPVLFREISSEKYPGGVLQLERQKTSQAGVLAFEIVRHRHAYAHSLGQFMRVQAAVLIVLLCLL